MKGEEFQEERRKKARESRRASGARVRIPPDDGIGAFPLAEDGRLISEDTPGQKESRAAFEAFNKNRQGCPWWTEYLDLRAEGWDWRKAALIAWLASPKSRRWPKTLYGLATEVLGLEGDRTLRKWREDDPKIDERAGRAQVAPLFEHRRDVIDALVAVAMEPNHLAHQDRKLFLTLTGDLKPDGAAGTGNAASDLGEVSEDELGAIAGALREQAARSGAA
jgi:hypothetical protein